MFLSFWTCMYISSSAQLGKLLYINQCLLLLEYTFKFPMCMLFLQAGNAFFEITPAGRPYIKNVAIFLNVWNRPPGGRWPFSFRNNTEECTVPLLMFPVTLHRYVRRILKLNHASRFVTKKVFLYKGLKKKKSQKLFENFSKFDFKMIAIIGKSFFLSRFFLDKLRCSSRA